MIDPLFSTLPTPPARPVDPCVGCTHAGTDGTRVWCNRLGRDTPQAHRAFAWWVAGATGACPERVVRS